MFNIDLSFFPSFGVKNKTIEDLVIKYYRDVLVSSKGFNYFLQLKIKNKKNINIYNTGRLLFQGNWIEAEIVKLVDFLLKKTNVCDFDACIGTDEAGKGERRGGLVVVAFGIKREDLSKLIVVGVSDSKRLNIEQLSETARKLETLGIYAIEKLDSEQFNMRWKQIGNLNNLLEEMHTNAISKLMKLSFLKWKGARSYVVFIDKFKSTQSSIMSSISIPDNLGIFIKYFEEHKAEKYPVVGAASILAKFFYEKALKEDKGHKDYKSVS